MTIIQFVSIKFNTLRVHIHFGKGIFLQILCKLVLLKTIFRSMKVVGFDA
jgi:hypothetical protein